MFSHHDLTENHWSRRDESTVLSTSISWCQLVHKTSDWPGSITCGLLIEQVVPVVFGFVWFGRMAKVTTIASRITDIMMYTINRISPKTMLYCFWSADVVKVSILIYSNKHVSSRTLRLILTRLKIIRMFIYALLIELASLLKTRQIIIIIFLLLWCHELMNLQLAGLFW